MRRCALAALGLLACCAAVMAADPDRDPAWAEAHRKPPMTADETRAFMKTLAQFVADNHMKKAENSAQRGMIYEYFRVSRKGQHDQFIQGEGLDTMHDGAWFAVAMVNAYRATGDPLYKEMLTRWQLPFYLKMLNHSDELFTSERNDGRPGDDRGWRTSKEWLLQGREKGFVPCWWDDGGSVSLDMLARKDKDEHVNFAGRNELVGRNPRKLLSGYSHGSSNHMAQDLAVMLQQCWLLLRESSDPADRKLTAELAEAAKNLQECRERHGFARIPAVRAAYALSNGDAAARAALPEETWKSVATAKSHYREAFFEFKPGQPVRLPGFADDQQYLYYVTLARRGSLVPPVAFRLVYDASTLPKLYQAYSDDSPVPPGINVFDLHPLNTFTNGKPTDYRSQRKGPFGGPRPIGSRVGPQNMIVSGWALQALRANKGLWDSARKQITTPNFFPDATEEQVRAVLERELSGGLRTWEAIFKAKGYIPTGMGAGNCGAGFPWDELSDTGGYAHLISAAAQWVLHLEGKADWEMHRVPAGR